MKVILLILLNISILFGSYVQEEIWWKGDSLLTFFKKHNIDKNLYFNLSKTDKELCSEINAGVRYEVFYDDENIINQILIPISEEMQIHIFKDLDNKFALDIIPIEYQQTFQTISMPITSSPYLDIVRNTGNRALANAFMLAFKTKRVNFKRLKKSDNLAIKFKQKIRNGRYFGTPEIIGAILEVRGKKHFIFQNPDDDRYYDNNAKALVKTKFMTPLRYKRISSHFTYKRWHPILHKYKTHLGVDFAAPTGRELKATADGRIIHLGRKGGYGKTIIIRHKNGYKSLYGHLSKYNRKLRVGSRVKQGDYIGNVGSTGRSTGPHLHFGIYKNGRAINPLKLLKTNKKKSNGKLKTKYIQVAKKIKKDLLKVLKIKQVPMNIQEFNNVDKMPKSYLSFDNSMRENYGKI